MHMHWGVVAHAGIIRLSLMLCGEWSLFRGTVNFQFYITRAMEHHNNTTRSRHANLQPIIIRGLIQTHTVCLHCAVHGMVRRHDYDNVLRCFFMVAAIFLLKPLEDPPTSRPTSSHCMQHPSFKRCVQHASRSVDDA